MKNKWMRSIIAMTAIISMVGANTACGVSSMKTEDGSSADKLTESQETAATQETGSQVTQQNLAGEISVTAWNSSYTAIVEGAAKFMEMHPEAKIKIEQVSDNTKLYTQLATGTGVPDIMQFQNRDTQTALSKFPGAFLDLTDVMQPKEKDIVPAVLPLCKEGEVYYAVPWDIAPAMLFYRKDIFEENGVKPDEIKTWEDYTEAGKVINTNTSGKTKLFGFDYNGASSFDMPLILFYEQGGSFFDKSGNVEFNTTETKKAFATIQNMIDAGITMNLSNEWTDRITALANDQLCTVAYGVWFAGTLSENLGDQAGLWGVIPLPAMEEGGNIQVNSGGSTIMVSAQTQYPELCKAFLDWFVLTDEGNAINMNISTLFDAYIPSFQDESYTKVNDYFGMSVAKLATTVCTEIPELPFPAYFTDIGTIFMTEAIGPYFIDGKDLDEVLNAATASGQKQLTFLKSE